MIWALSLLLLLFGIQIFVDKTNLYKQNSLLYYYVVLITFLLLNILRLYAQSIFGDIPNYERLFYETYPIQVGVDNISNELYVEWGFLFFISVFKFFSNDFSIFLFFISLFQLSIFYIFCKRFKISLFNAIPIYVSLTYTTFQIGMLRQALAFCFFLLALIYFNKKTIFLFFILIGFTVHRSILFGLMFLWIDKYINRKVFYLIMITSVVIYIFKIDLISDSFIFLDINDQIAGRVNVYLNVDRENNYLGIGFWERIILLILMNIAYNDLLRKNKVNIYNNIIYNLGMSVILLQLIFFSSPTITSRIRYFLVLFPIIFLTEYIHFKYRNGLKWFYQSIIFIYLLLYNYLLSTYLIL